LLVSLSSHHFKINDLCVSQQPLQATGARNLRESGETWALLG
jgi:hypothetical protein